MDILIITGGVSSERKISFISAKAVKQALEENNYIVKLYDLKKGYRELKKLVHDFDVIFPVLHGEEGEGGDLQKFLSRFNKPFVGGSWRGFKKGWYKIPFKKFCDKNKIPTAKWREVKNKNDIVDFGFPSVLKSSNGGSSKEVFILKSQADLNNKKIDKLLITLDFLIEEFISGIEVTVAILKNQALPVVEIVPPRGQWFDYKNKYSGATREIPNAPSLNPRLKKKVQSIALGIHQQLNLGHYSRMDFIVAKDIPYVLDVNTIPGLTSQSLFPKAAQAINIRFNQLVERLIKLAQKYDYST